MAGFHAKSSLKTNAALRTGRHLKLLPHVVDEHYYDATRRARDASMKFIILQLQCYQADTV
jgi:hypothetical protein